MKYISLDLETTGLVKDPNNILQLSMVVEDTTKLMPLRELPHLTAFVDQGTFTGSAFALQMNAWILKEIANANKGIDTKYPVVQPLALWDSVHDFINEHFGRRNALVAGKNVASFDLQFFPENVRARFKHRVIDPGPMFINWKIDDSPPDLATIKKRCGLDPGVSHDAYEDALDVIQVLRTQYMYEGA